MTIPATFRVTPNTAPTPTPVVPQPTLSPPSPRGPGRSRYPAPGPAPVAAPPSPVAPPAPIASPSSMPPALPDSNPPRRSALERSSVTPHNVASLGGDGAGLQRHHTQVDDVCPVGETRVPARGAHTYDGDGPAEPPNRCVLHLSSIDEFPENEVHYYYYDVDDIPVGTRDILRDLLAAACAHELNLTQTECDTVTTFLTTLPQPRRTSKEKSSNIGESRASDHYGHNTDVD